MGSQRTQKEERYPPQGHPVPRRGGWGSPSPTLASPVPWTRVPWSARTPLWSDLLQTERARGSLPSPLPPSGWGVSPLSGQRNYRAPGTQGRPAQMPHHLEHLTQTHRPVLPPQPLPCPGMPAGNSPPPDGPAGTQTHCAQLPVHSPRGESVLTPVWTPPSSSAPGCPRPFTPCRSPNTLAGCRPAAQAGGRPGLASHVTSARLHHSPISKCRVANPTFPTTRSFLGPRTGALLSKWSEHNVAHAIAQLSSIPVATLPVLFEGLAEGPLYCPTH